MAKAKKKTAKKKVIHKSAMIQPINVRPLTDAEANAEFAKYPVAAPKKVTGPKAGDITSMAFHYAGLVSWEEAEIDKVAKGKEVVWISNQLFEKKTDGTYVYEDNTVGPCKKVLHLDGGKRAQEYEESGD